MTARDLARRAVALALGLVVIGVALRVLRHYGWLELPPNFAPVSAIAMFAAVYLPRRLALAVPAALMVLSDALIGWYNLGVVAAVYASFAVSFGLGWWLRRRLTPARLIGGSLAGSLVFFFVTNAAVWAFESTYPNTLAGLLQSYVAGLPFLRYTVLGDLIYTGLFFGVHSAVVVYWRYRLQAASTELTHGRV